MPARPDLTSVLYLFGLSGIPQPLTGGSTQTYRAGEAVLKQIKETSLENNHSPALAAWMAGWSADLPQHDFRLPRPLPTTGGAWISADGWTAMSYLPGRHSGAADAPACIAAIQALHRQVQAISRHPAMDDNTTAWGFAHRGCWGDPPAGVQPELRPLLDELYALRQPIETGPWQLIHADLNPDNLLVAPGLAPAVLDFSPFWAPADFALAIYANFLGPRRRDLSVLSAFAAVPHFNQLLLRASIRMLLVVSFCNGLEGWQDSEEKWAAEAVVSWLKAQKYV
jgi:Ser/Thr protein kinase RdoA (MazF antagonist)